MCRREGTCCNYTEVPTFFVNKISPMDTGAQDDRFRKSNTPPHFRNSCLAEYKVSYPVLSLCTECRHRLNCVFAVHTYAAKGQFNSVANVGIEKSRRVKRRHAHYIKCGERTAVCLTFPDKLGDCSNGNA